VGGLTTLVAEIAAKGRAKGGQATAQPEKNATPQRFRRQEG
jgi:DNA repair protein RadA/Sms